MDKDGGMEERAAKSSPAFLHLSITLPDWFPESHTTIIQRVSILLLYPGLCCPSNVTFTPQDHRFQTDARGGQICPLFQSKLEVNWTQQWKLRTLYYRDEPNCYFHYFLNLISIKSQNLLKNACHNRFFSTTSPKPIDISAWYKRKEHSKSSSWEAGTR